MAFKPKSTKPSKTVEDIMSPEEEKFIGAAKADTLESSSSQNIDTHNVSEIKEDPKKPRIPKTKQHVHDLHEYVRRHEWPTTPFEMPSIAAGRSDLDKPFTMRLQENIWLSLERHCKALGVSKSEWVRHAMLKLMREEQEYFANKE
ncbi:hypothetical protein OR1_02707 [Geobacter sp. OR-1]|uniref:hypothetical protein n=1 Tax=Geobacter sp. OR-1 TaxID=1266765 RepID=UPI0005433612|nr:hypothetical protein [Geobacter sp. OR-1]GAM10418.1 hypothetical protein OR1_02707 [Geobacter sp. OR-1]